MKLHGFTAVVSSDASAESAEAYPPHILADYPLRISANRLGGSVLPCGGHPLRCYVGVVFCEGG